MSSKHKLRRDKGKHGMGSKTGREDGPSPRYPSPVAHDQQELEPLVESVVVESGIELDLNVTEFDTARGEEIDVGILVLEHEVEEAAIDGETRRRVLRESESLRGNAADVADNAPARRASQQEFDSGLDVMRFPFCSESEMEIVAAQEEEQMAMMEVELAMQSANFLEGADLVEEAMVLESSRLIHNWQHALDPFRAVHELEEDIET